MGEKTKYALSGALAGIANGLFGAGGGMVLVPMFIRFSGMEEKRAFATSIAVILPLSLVSAAVYFFKGEFDFISALPFIIGGAVGGFVGGKVFKKVSAALLRGGFALFMIYGGIRLLMR